MQAETLWEAQRLTDEAIDRVRVHANDEWMREVRAIVWRLARARGEFTTDAVWAQVDRLEATTHEPRAMGAVMRAAAKAGWVTPTDRVSNSARPECHCRPVRVWRSLVLEVQS